MKPHPSGPIPQQCCPSGQSGFHCMCTMLNRDPLQHQGQVHVMHGSLLLASPQALVDALVHPSI